MLGCVCHVPVPPCRVMCFKFELASYEVPCSSRVSTTWMRTSANSWPIPCGIKQVANEALKLTATVCNTLQRNVRDHALQNRRMNETKRRSPQTFGLSASKRTDAWRELHCLLVVVIGAKTLRTLFVSSLIKNQFHDRTL